MSRRNMKIPALATLLKVPGHAFAQDRALTVEMHDTQEQATPPIACLDSYGEDGVTAEYQQIG